MEADIVLKNGSVFLPRPDQPDRVIEEKTNIAVKDGLILQIGSCRNVKAEQTVSLKHLSVLPGLIDTQAHFREPGMEHKEDIECGSRAALKGGITAFFEMPNTIPPTITQEAFEDKLRRAEERSFCDFAFYAGARKDSLPFLKTLSNRPGLCGLKIFMGRSTGGLLLDDERLIEQAVAGSCKIAAIHSEDEERLQQRRRLADTPPPHPRNHPLWRDVQTALISTKKAARIASRLKKRIHILHISSAEEMAFLKNHRKYVSTEVTPQHLTLAAPDCYEKFGTLVQMNPPIRGERHRQALREALKNGLVDVIGSDHAPHTLEEKRLPYPQSPSGLPGIQTMLPLMLDHIDKGLLDLKLLVKLLAHNPARLFKIRSQGFIKKGLRAHFTVLDMKATQKIEESWLESKCGWSPFVGKTIKGRIAAVFLHGRAALKEGEFQTPALGQAVEFFG